MTTLSRHATVRDQYRFAAKLQSALTVAEVERTYLASVPDVLFARGHGLYRLDPDSGRVQSVCADVDADFLEEYELHGRAGDVVLEYVQQQVRPIDSSRVAKPAEWEGSGVYPVLARAGFHHSMEAPVVVAGVPCGTMNFARGRDDPPFSAADLRATTGIGEQLGLALDRALRYEETGQHATMLEDILNRLPQAVVITDLDANVIFRNRAATRSASGGRRSVADAVQPSIVEAMRQFRTENRRVSFSTVADGAAGRRLVVKSLRLGGSKDASLTLVYRCQDERRAGLPAWDVLSPREQEIAQFVSEGLTTKEIAARAFVTENTVKQHLKRIFAKVDVRNRAELMQRVWSAASPDDTGADERT